jgi:hypothetical protein
VPIEIGNGNTDFHLVFLDKALRLASIVWKDNINLFNKGDGIMRGILVSL